MVFRIAFTLCFPLAVLAGCGNGAEKTDPPSKTMDNKTQQQQKPTAKSPQDLAVVPDPVSVKIGGEDATQYILTNSNGVIVKLLDWGATVVSVQTPDRDGKAGEITLAYGDLETYGENPSYFGCTVGRYANRIANGKFTIDGTEHQVTTNNGSKNQHMLHGGKEGFNRRMWTAETDDSAKDAVSVKFTLVSPDGDQGFPGELTAHVTYTLNEDDELIVRYEATTTKPTHVNLTNHCYWNLAGGGDVLKHELTLHCDKFLPVDAELIPTGEIRDVAGTPWDFTKPTAIGARIDDEKLGKPDAEGRGYDHCYVIRGGGEKRHGAPLAARVHDPKSGRVLEVFTDQPGIQLYSGNFLDGSANSGGAPQHGAFCLECQQFPDAPNQSSFPSTLKQPGEVYTQTTVHRFSVQK